MLIFVLLRSKDISIQLQIGNLTHKEQQTGNEIHLTTKNSRENSERYNNERPFRRDQNDSRERPTTHQYEQQRGPPEYRRFTRQADRDYESRGYRQQRDNWECSNVNRQRNGNQNQGN